MPSQRYDLSLLLRIPFLKVSKLWFANEIVMLGYHYPYQSLKVLTSKGIAEVNRDSLENRYKELIHH